MTASPDNPAKPETIPAAPPSWGRRIIITLVLAGVGLLGYLGWSRWRQELASKQLRDEGFLVFYDDEFNAQGERRQTPVTSSGFAGVVTKWTRYPIAVYFNEQTRRSDVSALFGCIDHLPHLAVLSIQNSNISNADLHRFKHLTKLQNLILESSAIQNGPTPGLEHLSLKWISFRRTRFNDEGMQSIASIKTLETLDLDRTQVTDASIPWILSLPHLKGVCVRRSLVTLEGFKQLRDESARRSPNFNVYWENLHPSSPSHREYQVFP
jgi:hypothetical protein